MKKILRCTALLLLPILLYYTVFLAFEPNNYFGLRAVTPTGAVFGSLRAYDKNPTQGILLGDSRFANIESMDVLQEATGREYTNLAFGGASLQESLDELEYLLNRYPEIEEVVFELSFYTLNEHYDANRFEFIELALYNPFVYMTNLSYNLEALQNFVYWMQGVPLYGGAQETRDPETDVVQTWQAPSGESVSIREDVLSHLGHVMDSTENWSIDTSEQAEFARLVSLIERCEEEGIRFVVVLPPIHDAAYTHVVQQNGIESEMQAVLAQLSNTSAVVLDYEITNRPNYTESHWFDSLHLDYVHGLPLWTQQLAEDLA